MEMNNVRYLINFEFCLIVNIAGVEVLYEKIVEWCGVITTIIVFDICCGIGIIGLILVKVML